ncbi:MAG: thioredoxin domain-containing protein [Planctomycetota bacterium]|jgi:protein-disulfide isomerase/uncharacterized membrane protein
MATLATKPPGAVEEVTARRPAATAARLVLLLASLGILVAGHLTYLHLFEGGRCTGRDCHAVLDSPYARLLGVPLAALGLGLYVALVVAARQRAGAWVRLLAVLGNLPAPYLLYLQAARLDAWCGFCLASTALFALILVCSLRGRTGRLAWSFAPPVAFLLPVLLVLGLEQAIAARDVRRALAPAGEGGVVTIAGRTFSLAEIDRALARELARLEWEKHRTRLEWVERTVLEREAQAQALSVDELSRRNVDHNVTLSSAEIEAAYRRQGGTESPIPKRQRMTVAARLALEKRRAVEAAYLDALRAKYAVAVDLPPPAPVGKTAFNPRRGPEAGPPAAALQIVLFSDFACPACARVHAWLDEMRRARGGEVRVAFRHFPLEGHRQAEAFAAAAVGAHEQGKFWAFADVLFRHHRDLDPQRVEEYAREAGLDLEAFRRCLASDRPRRVVAADCEEGRRLGVQATPGLFLNGVYFTGVPDRRLVDALSRPSRGR